MNKVSCILVAFFLLSSISSAQTTIPGGSVSGVWTSVGSPYLVEGALLVPDGSTLTIEPGAEVRFQGPYKLLVLGRLLAIGSSTDSIAFTAADTTIGWLGIQYENTPITNDTSKHIYCKLQYVKSGTGGGAFYLVNFPKVIISNCTISHCKSYAYPGGAAIHCAGGKAIITNNMISNNWTSFGGAGIFCENSNPIITNNTIVNNVADGAGGGITCSGIFNSSNALISGNFIYNNRAAMGGGIACSNNSPKIWNNVISNNTASNGGGIHCSQDGDPAIMDNVISNNLAMNGGGGVYFDYAYGGPAITNCTMTNNKALLGGALFCTLYSNVNLNNSILWDNIADSSGQQVYLDDENSDPDFHFCDVQDGASAFGLNGGIFYTGVYEHNLDTLPFFVSPTAGSGTSYNGANADWSLQVVSPCINAGTTDTTGLQLYASDLAGNPRISGMRIDMGAYEYQLPAAMDDILGALSFEAFPNPVLHDLTIQVPHKAYIEISSMDGLILKTIYMNDGWVKVDLTNLPNGIYFITAKSKKGIASRKIIKE